MKHYTTHKPSITKLFYSSYFFFSSHNRTMNGKDALLDHHHDDDNSRANFDTIFSGGSVSLSKLLLMPPAASFQNTNINNFPPTSPILPPPPHHQQHRLSLITHPADQQTLLNQSLLPFRSSSSSSSLQLSHKRPRQQQLIKHLPSSIVPTSALARQRRARMSDKTRCLQKLIPLERHMDTATLYEETYKYIKFLEAQITVLHSMPLQTTTTTTSIKQLSHDEDIFYGGVLGRLNRQQLLQVLTNSQVAQTVMYTAGWCVFSAEQLRMISNNDRHPFI